MPNSIVVIFGTRPEIIKLAPIVRLLSESPDFRLFVLATGQHLEMAKQALAAFNIKPNFSFGLMKTNQSPNSFLGELLARLENVFSELNPAGVIVQGDTTTALGGALSAFHSKIPVAHVEAGLRTGNLYSPFPEELNRRLIGQIAALHFCPTEGAKDALVGEGRTQGVYVVGNTAVDSLLWMLTEIDSGNQQMSEDVKSIPEQAKVVLVTGHRRENFDQPMEVLCRDLLAVVESREDLELVYPVHLNPNVQRVVRSALGAHPRIRLLPPLDYTTFVYLMRRADLIVTDSGGIQEEAPSLGKYVIVTRESTERPEASKAGLAEIVPLTEEGKLKSRIEAYFRGEVSPALSTANPYGDGQAASRILEILKNHWA